VNISELKARVKAGKMSPIQPSEEISAGELLNSAKELVNYSITHGWNLISSKECDERWSQHTLELLEYIDSQEYDDEELSNIIDSIQTEDFHWNWFAKSFAMHASEYAWFYLYAENKPQGACVIYQPKGSALQKSNIFYVEFLAVAPWNRDCLIRERDLHGVGSILLKAVLDFSVNELGLSPGFSLHSLPQAKGYYEKLNMVNVKGLNKDALLYFELPEPEANIFLGAS